MFTEETDLWNAWGLFQNQWNTAVKLRWGQLANLINAMNVLGATWV